MFQWDKTMQQTSMVVHLMVELLLNTLGIKEQL